MSIILPMQETILQETEHGESEYFPTGILPFLKNTYIRTSKGASKSDQQREGNEATVDCAAAKGEWPDGEGRRDRCGERELVKVWGRGGGEYLPHVKRGLTRAVG